MINTSIESGYCTISTLYDRIAESLGLSTKDVKYACSKVCVSHKIMEEVYSYYITEQKADKDSVNMWWVCYGPKAVDYLKDRTVQVEDGWITKENN